MFEEDRCRLIDERAKTDTYIKYQLAEIISHLEKAGVDHTPNLEHAFGLYNEILVLDQLGQKCNIDAVKRSKGKNTPEFKITSKDTIINLELKTLFAADSVNTILEIQEQTRVMNIKVKEIQAGKLPPSTPLYANRNFFKNLVKRPFSRSILSNYSTVN